MPEVSVIVPNYNHGKYLAQRLDSILAQGFRDFEVIILDDFSTDNSREVIETYRHHPQVTQVLFNEANSGNTFHQWQKGITLASGNLIWMAESDDWCEPTFLEEMVLAFQQYPKLVLGFCQLLCVRDGQVAWQTMPETMQEFFEGEDFVKTKMLGSNFLPNASAVLFKKAAFVKVPEDYVRMRYAGDWYVWAHICMQGQVFASGRYLNYFRKHGADVSGKAAATGLDFTEGDEVFRSILTQLHPSRPEIILGLEKRMGRFNLLKNGYNESTKKQISYILDSLYTETGFELPKKKGDLKERICRKIGEYLK